MVEVAERRGPASVAATMFADVLESRVAREQHALERRLARPLGADLGARPTKQARAGSTLCAAHGGASASSADQSAQSVQPAAWCVLGETQLREKSEGVGTPQAGETSAS